MASVVKHDQAKQQVARQGGITPGPASSYAYADTAPTSGWASRFFEHASQLGSGRYESDNTTYTRQPGDRLPDGRPIVPADMTLRQAADGAATLRFDMTTMNSGRGPMEIMLGDG